MNPIKQCTLHARASPPPPPSLFLDATHSFFTPHGEIDSWLLVIEFRRRFCFRFVSSKISFMLGRDLSKRGFQKESWNYLSSAAAPWNRQVWYGLVWDGMGWDGMGWDVTGWEGMVRYGMGIL